MTASRHALLAASMAIALGVSGAIAQQQPQDNAIEVAPDDTPLAPGADDRPRFQPPPPPVSTAGVSVSLRGLDKLTGLVETIDAQVGASAIYERLQIDVRGCYKRTAERAPESSVFLQIYDTKDEPPTQVFSGWMFASSPALSAMDHPRYDVWVLSCNTS